MNILENKTIVISGASSGIGKEIALSLQNYNVCLLLLGRNEAVLKNMANASKKAKTCFLKVDFSRDEDLKALNEYIKGSDLEPDILIHCAGVFHSASVSETSAEIMDEAYMVNFRAPFIITRDLLGFIKKAKGQIIFISTTASIHPKANLAAYASAKAALNTFVEVLHQEVYPFGVRITNIFPGRVATPMQENVCKLEGKDYVPENFIHPSVLSNTVIDLLTLPANVEISELIIRPT
jgi:short-subunit dehydrogenase